MKNLLLMRHATAAEKETGQQDADRELTLFGERQAGEMGIKLKSLGLVPELVLCSPAVRTRATVENLMAEVGRNLPLQLEQVIYHGSETEICVLSQMFLMR
ncbi:SixA phosphatase family protein [Rufibacter ruber]|uniref:SixA phosphatase family protein n=1 Tax=Rufibacter ruber TaxID=1783499 RepID=UPI0009EE1548|nr:histidine phosphatase family protein [Rufibacter ruber]